MSESVIVGIIAALASIIAAILTSRATQNKVQNELHEQNAVQNVKIDHLAEEQKSLREEVRKHNNYAERISVVEEKIKVANNRIGDLERKVG